MRKGDTRRRAIMDISERLFLQRGYDNTSIQDILDALRLSKGGFYHHFESKQSLLEAICEERTAEAVSDALENLPADADPLARLNAVYALTGFFSLHDPMFTATLVKAAYREDGAKLREAMLRTGKERVLPLLRQAVSDGAAQGVFHPVSPGMTADMLYLMGNALYGEIARAVASRAPDAMTVAMDCLTAYRKASELLLGAPYGSVLLADMRRIDTIRRTLDDPRLT